MITQYRPAYYDNPRASTLSGLSTDQKPTDVENGTRYEEIDTGKTFCFDKENKAWYEMPQSGGGGSSVSVEPITITKNGVTTAPDGVAYSPITTDTYTQGGNKITITEDDGSMVVFTQGEAQAEKTVAIAKNGAFTVEPDAGFAFVKKVSGTVAVPTPEPVLQEKSVNITRNGPTSVTPDAGKDGLSKVNITADIQFVRNVELSETSETEVESLGAWVVLATMGSIGVTPKELCRSNFEEIVIDATLPNGASMTIVYCVDVDTTLLPVLAGKTPSTVTFRSAAGEVNIPINGTMVTVSPEILEEIKSQITTWLHGVLGSTPTITFSDPAHIGTKLF